MGTSWGYSDKPGTVCLLLHAWNIMPNQSTFCYEAVILQPCDFTRMVDQSETYFLEVDTTTICGTPVSDQRIEIVTPACFAQARSIALMRAFSDFTTSAVSFMSTCKEWIARALPDVSLRIASTNSVSVLDLRPRGTNSNSASSMI